MAATGIKHTKNGRSIIIRNNSGGIVTAAASWCFPNKVFAMVQTKKAENDMASDSVKIKLL